MKKPDPDFKNKVYALVKSIPEGKVTTYGDVASSCGHPYAARIIGGLAHYGPEELPWHRVVNRFGGLAAGYPGGRDTQQAHLDAEGIVVRDGTISDFALLRWTPKI